MATTFVLKKQPRHAQQELRLICPFCRGKYGPYMITIPGRNEALADAPQRCVVCHGDEMFVEVTLHCQRCAIEIKQLFPLVEEG